MSDSEDVQSSSSATTSRRSSYLTTSEDEEDDVLNNGTTGHIVDGSVLSEILYAVNIVPLLSVYQYLLCVALLILCLIVCGVFVCCTCNLCMWCACSLCKCMRICVSWYVTCPPGRSGTPLHWPCKPPKVLYIMHIPCFP